MQEKKILIIDDEPDVLKTSVLFLEAAGFKVITASDGMEGLRKARTESPDLIVTDIMLPKLDGYRLCRMLKFDDKYKKIPVIFLTARAQDSDEQMSKEVCADFYMRKPFAPQALISKIKEFIG